MMMMVGVVMVMVVMLLLDNHGEGARKMIFFPV